jgi:hypothetical protein
MSVKFFISEEEKKNILNLYSITEQSFISKLISKGKGLFDNTTCSTEYTDDAKDWKDLYNMLVTRKKIKQGTPMLILWGPSQTMYYTKDGKSLIKEMLVSTGEWGFGNSEGNPSTSTGLMKITNKIKTPRKYQVLVSKTPTNVVLGPNIDSVRKDKSGEKHKAEVLTGILELTGLEPCNKNVAARNIYIHGTNQEHKLGRKVSHGCIRVSNDNILSLISTIPNGCKLYIRP